MQLSPDNFFSFKLDDFQLQAIEHLEEGKSVVVSSPTGSGKTVIAEYAVEMALAANKRCFYTTPLKALSNQKLYDFRQKFGDDKVGLLTGDVSINRDAAVVVMTTEVFRNMLYGTALGDIDRNLRNVSFVILDECHYMNDAQRGTVWEESIIYAPKDIQLVALSATIANAQELTQWIDETHGPTELVTSSFRPVPLRFYYFGARHLYPLLTPGHGMNKSLKDTFGRSKKTFRGNRRSIIASMSPRPGDILATMASRNMLPAIYFLFSRRGCEEAMTKARGIPLLNHEEEAELKIQVEHFVGDNPNLKNHPHLPYLFEGMSVHHAGMLPSWKAMVEKLFQKGLLKVVFATETLAAGINMPARTTVISSISKRDDEGHRQLTASEFLQMSGRAGRRGMDEVGHVVVVNHPFEPVEDAGKLAQAPSDPLSSRFTPSYGMILNLLQRHTIEEAQELIEKSFGQFMVSQELEPLYLQTLNIERELDRLAKPLCPGELGDLPLYKKRLEAVHSKEKQLKLIQRGLPKENKDAGGVALAEVKTQIREMLDLANGMPCHGCPVQKPCSKQTERIEHLRARHKQIEKRIHWQSGRYWRTFEALANILRIEGYIQGDTPTTLGLMAATIRGTNELFLTEVALSGVLETLRPPELAGVITALVTEDDRVSNTIRAATSPQVEIALGQILKTAKHVLRLQKEFEIEVPVSFSPVFSGLCQMWAEGSNWDEIRNASPFDEGDIVRALRRTLDLCRQFIRAPGMPEPLVAACQKAEALIARDEVREDF